MTKVNKINLLKYYFHSSLSIDFDNWYWLWFCFKLGDVQMDVAGVVEDNALLIRNEELDQHSVNQRNTFTIEYCTI